MPKQYTPIMSTIEFDCVSLCEMNVGQRCMYTLAGDQSLALFKSLSVTSDVQAIVYMDVFSQVLPRSTFFYHPSKKFVNKIYN